jgi:ribonucleoside-diphosphate reductase beta chain
MSLRSPQAVQAVRIPWAFDFWKRQQQIHWMPEEVPLGEDCRDWAQKLTDHERNLLTQIFRFFTQATSRCRIATTRNTAACSSLSKSR